MTITIDKDEIFANFNVGFGGDNHIVDRSEELTPDAVEYILEWSWVKGFQRDVVGQLIESGNRTGGIFQTDMVEKLYGQLVSRSGLQVTGMLQDILYRLYDNGVGLPPFVRLSDSGVDENMPAPDFRLMFMFVNHRGHRLPVIITPEMLSGRKNPVFEIDGYVDSAMVVGTPDTAIRFDGVEWRAQAKEFVAEGAVKNFLRIMQGNVPFRVPIPTAWPNIMKSSFSEQAIERSTYYYTQDFLMDLELSKYVPYSATNNAEFTAEINGRALGFRHIPARPLGENGIPQPDGDVAFFYQGGSDALEQIDGLDEKLLAITTSLEDTGRLLGDGIKQVYVRESYAGMIGVIVGKTDKMYVPTGELKKLSADGLAVAARHEALHHVTAASGMLEDIDMIEFFSGTLSGRPPVGNLNEQWDSPSEYHPFFRFIREKNIYGEGAFGGPAANIGEFCVSFMNALMDMDRLKAAFDSLSEPERKDFLELTLKAVELMWNASGTPELEAFFAERHETISKW